MRWRAVYRADPAFRICRYWSGPGNWAPARRTCCVATPPCARRIWPTHRAYVRAHRDENRTRNPRERGSLGNGAPVFQREFPIPGCRRICDVYGHDVMTIQEAGNRPGQAMADEAVLAFAREEGRARLTLNRKHFIRLHKAAVHHAGIIACSFEPGLGGVGTANPCGIRVAASSLRARLVASTALDLDQVPVYIDTHRLSPTLAVVPGCPGRSLRRHRPVLPGCSRR